MVTPPSSDGRCSESEASSVWEASDAACDFAPLDGFEHGDGNVGDADFVFFLARCLHAVVHHHVAEGAGHRDPVGAGLDEFLGADIVDLVADVFFHPHAGAAGATAHAFGAAALGLDELDTTERAEHLARRHVHVVVPAEVARVVVHDPLVEFGTVEIKSPLVDEPLKELAVMHDLVVAAELGVLVGERVEAVRALGDDLLHAHRVEGLDVLGCEHLEQVLVAGAAGGIAGAGLGRAEDGEVDVGALHELRHRLGDLLVLVVERAGAADQ